MSHSEVSTRIVLFTGKGGVGKTTVAAATALSCADAGLRTLVISTDPAHSLADAFDTPLDSRPREISPNLSGQQLDATERLEETWADVQQYLVQLFDWAGVSGIEAEELAVVPGLDEVFALADLKAFAESGDWDVVVVDCGPTAETIRFLALPQILGWYMDRAFPATRAVTGILRPVLDRVTNLPIANDDVFVALRKFYDRLDGVRTLLTDPELSSVRLVVNPEKMVIAEARRTATYLSLFGYRVDAVVANRMLPEAVTDPWFKAWQETQAEHLATILTGFAPTPVLKAELASDELVGIERLRAYGADLYDGFDAADVLHVAEPMQVEDGATLVLHLPFADRDDLEVGHRDGELLVRVGPHRRAVVLPDSLKRRAIQTASLDGGTLRVRFAERTTTT